MGCAFLFFHQMKAEKCVVSAQLYKQSAYTQLQKEMYFLGLSMGEFSRFKRISSSFYSENLLLYDRVAFLIFGIVITHSYTTQCLKYLTTKTKHFTFLKRDVTSSCLIFVTKVKILFLFKIVLCSLERNIRRNEKKKLNQFLAHFYLILCTEYLKSFMFFLR